MEELIKKELEAIIKGLEPLKGKTGGKPIEISYTPETGLLQSLTIKTSIEN